jgi:hypothetical protein
VNLFIKCATSEITIQLRSIYSNTYDENATFHFGYS